jgi:hypothetical protein
LPSRSTQQHLSTIFPLSEQPIFTGCAVALPACFAQQAGASDRPAAKEGGLRSPAKQTAIRILFDIDPPRRINGAA